MTGELHSERLALMFELTFYVLSPKTGSIAGAIHRANRICSIADRLDQIHEAEMRRLNRKRWWQFWK
jgi:hypothetical protein